MPKDNDIWLRPNNDLEDLANAALFNYPELEDLQFLYLVTNAKTKCQPHLLSAFERYLASEYGHIYTFALIVNDARVAGEIAAHLPAHVP